MHNLLQKQRASVSGASSASSRATQISTNLSNLKISTNLKHALSLALSLAETESFSFGSEYARDTDLSSFQADSASSPLQRAQARKTNKKL